jgi:hemolysin III
MMAAARTVRPAEFAADRLVHVVGLVAAGVGVLVLAVLAATSGRPIDLIPVSAYALGLLAMLGFSAAYNIARRSRHRDLLRRFDHAAIFAMIAGTYTPFTTLALSGSWAIGMTILVWTIAGLGIALKLILPQRRWEGLSVALYLVFGWIVLIAVGPLSRAVDTSVLVLLGAGGVVYSLGVIFHGWGRLPFQNAIWHGFVLAAAAIHYAAICALVTANG